MSIKLFLLIILIIIILKSTVKLINIYSKGGISNVSRVLQLTHNRSSLQTLSKVIHIVEYILLRNRVPEG